MRIDVDRVKLKSGAHNNPQHGLCVMEAVAYIARENHSDHPECVSPVIATFLRTWNDAMDDTDRQRLKALIPVVMDTRSTPEDEDRRAWMALDWLVRVHTPAWLRLAGLVDHADRLAGLSEFKAGMDVPAIKPVLDAARSDAAAAGDAAGDAARDAAGAAARDAAGAAARAAAGDAARDAARAAAWAAARDAAWAAARAAAWDAAGDALRPTVVELQDSALALVERMAWLKDDD
jgi:alkylation response protein AidB-like acyl-CoA dehydrogenase